MTIVPTRTIAVFGATGQQGGSVTDALLAQGATVRALVRDPGSDRARVLAERGVELAATDVGDPQSLVAALTGVDAVFLMTIPPGGMQNPDVDGETRQGIALVDAAAAARVPHVVLSSVGGAERRSGVPHFESKRRVEERLEQSGLHATILRPAFFADNFAGMGPSLEDGEIVVRLPLPDGVPLQMVAARDIGRIATSALLGMADVPAFLEIAGDERTGGEIAAAFGEHTGRPARYEALPLEVLDGQDDMQAMFRWFAETFAYQADLMQVRAIEPTVLDLPGWLADTGYTIAD